MHGEAVVANRSHQLRFGYNYAKGYYENKVKDLHDFKPRNWWGEVKQLCGSAKLSSGRDLTCILHPDLVCDEPTLANKINQAFVSVMDGYSPLTESMCVDTNGDQPIKVTEISVRCKLREISCARAGGPDDLPNSVLREFADILAAPVANILNSSFSECKIPRAWKIADVSHPLSTTSIKTLDLSL